MKVKVRKGFDGAEAETPRALRRWEIGREFLSPKPTRGLESVMSSHSPVRGTAPVKTVTFKTTSVDGETIAFDRRGDRPNASPMDQLLADIGL